MRTGLRRRLKTSFRINKMNNKEEVKEKNTRDIWNPKMKVYEPVHEITENDKHRINNRWCDYMAWIFEKYRDKFTKIKINLPELTAKIFKNNNVNIGGSSEDDIYNTFDEMIRNEQHIEDYLNEQRGKYSGVMPF